MAGFQIYTYKNLLNNLSILMQSRTVTPSGHSNTMKLLSDGEHALVRIWNVVGEVEHLCLAGYKCVDW